jgi:hypothetical protein
MADRGLSRGFKGESRRGSKDVDMAYLCQSQVVRGGR